MKVWFDTQKRMEGGTPRTVCARSQAEFDEYKKKGWIPLMSEGGASVSSDEDPTKVVKDVTKTTGSKKSPEQIILAESAVKVIGLVADIKDEGQLRALLTLEQGSKQCRKTVVDALEKALETFDDE